MPKNIMIKKVGTAQNFSGVTHITVPDEQSGDVDFVPLDDYKGGVKIITENGTYAASDDGLAGYTMVRVQVQPTEITGYKDGQQYTVKKDSNGNLLWIPANEATEFDS